MIRPGIDVSSGSYVNVSRASWRRFALAVIVLALGLAPAGPAQEIDMDAVEAQEEFRWGVRAFHNGLYNEAILAFNRSLSFAPGNNRVHFWLGRAYYYSGFERAALEEWRTVIRAGDDGPFMEHLVDVVSARAGLSQELSEQGRFVVTSELPGRIEDSTVFRRPLAVEARPDGSFYVTSFGDNNVLLLNPNGGVRRRLEGGLSDFNRPFDVAYTDRDFLFISEFGADRIAKCRMNGSKLATFGGSGSGDGELHGPQHIAVDGDNHLYVTDWGNQRVSKYTYDGEYVLRFGEAAGAFPGLAEPTGIAYLDGRIFVADRARGAIYSFDESGNFLGELAGLGLEKPESLDVYGSNRLLVSDSTRLLLIDVERETVSELSAMQGYQGRVTSAAVDANGRVIAADFDENKLLFLSEISSLYSGLFVQIERVQSEDFPTVYVDVSVEDRLGNPLVGLAERNFLLTEDHAPMSDVSLVWAEHASDEVESLVLVERSPAMRDARDRLDDLASQLQNLRRDGMRMGVVSAGESATVEMGPGGSDPALRRALRDGAYSSGWAFDTGLRLAVSELVNVRRSRAVIYVSTGTLPQDAFQNYALEVLAEYMKNNHVQFFTVYMNQDSVSRELQFLTRETGGASYYLYNPNGIAPIASDIAAHQSGRYTLRATSRRDSDFGRAYLPLEAEAYLIRQSGRDQAGFFAPLQF